MQRHQNWKEVKNTSSLMDCSADIVETNADKVRVADMPNGAQVAHGVRE